MHQLLFPTSRPFPLRVALLSGAAACVFSLCSAAAAPAQVVVAPITPQVGSSDPVSAEPGVKRPSTTPCIVPLFTNQGFNDFNNKAFTYTPPAGCAGPWSKVVFTVDFTVTEGRQYDRTAEVFLGNTIMFFGTTAEPRAALSPSWHVEKDVTDLSALFKTAQAGQTDLGNFVGTSGGVVYDGLIYGSAELEFYPANLVNPAPIVPDAVLPLPGNGSTYGLNETADIMQSAFTMPRNIEAAYLDVYSQGQSSDEFWYTCSPNEVASELDNCGNTSFREAQILIDSKPAGIAPIYPWIFTGGIDPYLWEPLVGVQTLNFKAFRVNLTPFAGMLSNGVRHTIGVRVYNADSYFSETANLLLYLDHGSAQTSGAVTANSLPPLGAPVVYDNYGTDDTGGISGTTFVGQQHNYTIAGYVDTSHGRVETTVEEVVDFGNYQTIVDDSTQYVQTVEQVSGASSKTYTKDGPLHSETDELIVYPFTFSEEEQVNSDGSLTVLSKVGQKDYTYEKKLLEGYAYYTDTAQEAVDSADTLDISSSYTITGHTGTASTSSYQDADSLGHCYSRTLTSADLQLTSVKDGAACGGSNHP